MWRSVTTSAVFALICACLLPLGSDTSIASLFFGCVISLFCVIHILVVRAPIGGLACAGVLLSVCLYLVGLFKGWASSGADDYSALSLAFGIFAVAQIAARDSDRIRTLWSAMLGFGLILSAVAFVDFIADRSTYFGLVESSGHSSGGRLAYPLASSNNTATFFGVIALMALVSLMKSVTRTGGSFASMVEQVARNAWLPAAALLLSLACVFLTASRAGSTLLIVSLVVLLIWEGRRSFVSSRRTTFKALALPAAVVVVVGVVFVVSGDIYADRLLATLERQDGRASLFSAYLSALSIAPLLGHGLGGFHFVNALVADAQNARDLMGTGAAHNVLLQWGLEAGIVGVGFVLSISGAWLAIMRRGLRRRSRQTRYLRGTIVIALFVAAHGMVDFALQIQGFLWFFAWVCGLGAGVATGGTFVRAPAGPLLSRAITSIVAAILLATSLLSGMAFLDRYGADEISRMDDATFMARFEEREDLRGSSYRLAQIGGRALRLEAPDGELARRALQASVAVEPRDGSVWFSYAIAVALDEGAFNEEALSHLERSYALMPYGRRDFARARVDFIELTWAYVSNPIREAAIREARIFSSPGQLERLERHYALQSIDG